MLTVPFIISENQRTIHKNTQEKKREAATQGIHKYYYSSIHSLLFTPLLNSLQC